METYIIEDDEVGKRFVDVLIKKRAQGVQVNFIYDSVGSINTSKAFFQRLTDSGIRVLEFNPINPLTAKSGWDVNQRDHRKLLIVDGKTRISWRHQYQQRLFRGLLQSQVTTAPQWRPALARYPDTSRRPGGRRVSETVSRHMGKAKRYTAGSAGIFCHNWVTRAREVVRAIASTSDEPYSLIYVTLLSAINSAETSIHLTNAYFAPDAQLLAALKDAAGRGVDVRMILPSKTDSWLVFNTGRSYYSELLAAGVKIYERRDALLHAKTALIDGVWSTIGSTNLDWRSFLYNDEVNAVILGPEFGAQMQAMFDTDLASSNLITLEAWQHRSISERMKEGCRQVVATPALGRGHYA